LADLLSYLASDIVNEHASAALYFIFRVVASIKDGSKLVDPQRRVHSLLSTAHKAAQSLYSPVQQLVRDEERRKQLSAGHCDLLDAVRTIQTMQRYYEQARLVVDQLTLSLKRVRCDDGLINDIVAHLFLKNHCVATPSTDLLCQILATQLEDDRREPERKINNLASSPDVLHHLLIHYTRHGHLDKFSYCYRERLKNQLAHIGTKTHGPEYTAIVTAQAHLEEWASGKLLDDPLYRVTAVRDALCLLMSNRQFALLYSNKEQLTRFLLALPRLESRELNAIQGLVTLCNALENHFQVYLGETVMDVLTRLVCHHPVVVVTPHVGTKRKRSKAIGDMALSELVHDMEDEVTVNNSGTHLVNELTQYHDAFVVQFLLQSTSFDQPTHVMLSNLTALLKTYGRLVIEHPLTHVTRDMTRKYNELMAQFLEGIVLSVDGVREHCACCDVSFVDCVKELEGVQFLVLLSRENQAALCQLLTLTKLPVIEREFLGQSDLIMGDDNNNNAMVEEEGTLFDIEEDATELGRFDEEEGGDCDEVIQEDVVAGLH
jgi:hypothetical protein